MQGWAIAVESRGAAVGRCRPAVPRVPRGSGVTVLYLVLALASALGFYLATAHQRLRPAWRTRARALRLGAWACAALALACAVAALGPWAGVFAALTMFMLGAVALPYLDAWRHLRRERADVG